MIYIQLVILVIMCINTSITYTRNDLFRLGNRIRGQPINLPADFIDTAVDLRLIKTRGKRAVRWKSRSHDKHQTCINQNNLIKVPLSCATPKGFHSLLINARSIRSNGHIIRDQVEQYLPTIVALTETWSKNDDKDFLFANVAPAGYMWYNIDRDHSRGGGVAILYDKNTRCAVHATKMNCDIEFLWCITTIGHKTLQYLVLYRPPSGSLASFFDEFILIAEEIDSHNSEVIITGDFNLHVDNPNLPEVAQFLEILNSFGLVIKINDSTHIAGHTLDLIITRKESGLVQNVIADDLISDHLLVRFDLNIQLDPERPKTVKYRSLRSLNVEMFEEDLRKSKLVTEPADDIDSLVSQYNSTLAELLDKHAPIQVRTITKKQKNPWYTSDIHTQRKIRRRLTRKWRKSKSIRDKQAMIDQRNKVSQIINQAKSTFYQQTITNIGNDSKRLFQTIRELLGDRKINPMPPGKTPVENANDFNHYFIDKINRLKSSFDQGSHHSTHDGNVIDQRLPEFRPLSLEKVTKLISTAPSKTCTLDPIPTSIVKSTVNTMAPIIQKIINQSLCRSIVPSDFKTAIVKPLLKKPGLDPIHKNYRPVSNLAFVSKLIEQSVIDQLDIHFEVNKLNDQLQSAYRAHHSTETALIHTVDDILTALDNRRAVCMGMLDLSAAFDTINHDIMIERLSTSQGVNEPITAWFNSYLRGRTQRTNVEDATSDYIILDDGAVQGSKLGCRLYKKYVEPLGKLFAESDCSFHGYADDNTIWKIVDPKSPRSVHSGMLSLETTIDQARVWMFANKLCLNDSKTEFIVFGLPRHTTNMQPCNLAIGDEIIQPVGRVKNLGVTLDTQLNFRDHISNIVKACRYQIRRTWHIRKHLNEEAAKRVMLATVISRLDYCNSLLVNLPQKDIRKLQKVQNSAARLVTLTPRTHAITPSLKHLHWLPVIYRIKYKIATIVHKCIYGQAPSYLKQLIKAYVPARQLRSSNDFKLNVPSVKQQTVGSRAFSVAGPTIWNDLPKPLRNTECYHKFRSNLKTLYFSLAFEG